MYQSRGYVTMGPQLTTAVKYLVIASAVAFVWTFVGAGGEIIRTFGLIPQHVWGKLFVFQLVTYIFLHGDFLHIALNMFVLWMFGCEFERQWGTREFLRFFFVTGIGAGVLSVLVDPFSTIPIVGASGAIYGLLMAYGMLYPNRVILLFFVFPVKARIAVIVLGAMAFLSAWSSTGGGIAHVAHLGGMLVAFLYLKGLLNPASLRQAYYRWKIRRMRSRFQVHENPRHRSRKDDDFWIN